MKTSTSVTGQAVEEHWIEVDGTSTRYLEAGKGAPVLLLPGEGGVAEQWQPVLAGLGDSHRVIAVDLPGYGYTDPVPDGSATALARFVWRFAQRLGLEAPAVIGHSLGGAVAVHLALQRPGWLSSLVLASPAGMGRAINPGMVVQAVTPLGDLTKALIPIVPGAPELLVASLAVFGARRPWRLPRAWCASQVKTASDPVALATTLRSQRSSVGLLGQTKGIVRRLPELAVPVLVLWGVQDIVVPFWQAIGARRRLGRGGQLRLFPWAGHLMPLEAADRFLDVVRPFLARAEGSAPKAGH